MHNKAIKVRPQAGLTSVALLGLCLFATLVQTNQRNSGPL
jgi:hypothetical protein